jgi:hypothetical protein
MHKKLSDRYHARRGKSVDVQVALPIDKCLPPRPLIITGSWFVESPAPRKSGTITV